MSSNEVAVDRRRVPVWLERGASYGWRVLVIAAVVVVTVELLGRLLVVVLPIVVAVLLARILRPVVRRLDRVLPHAAAVAIAVLGFVGAAAAGLSAIGMVLAKELADLGPTVDQGLVRLEDWAVQRELFGLDRAGAQGVRREAVSSLRALVRSSQGSAVAGARLVGELLVGAVLCVVVTFFVLKDGDRAVRRARLAVPAAHRDRASRMGMRAWQALGGFLRAAALLGLVEGAAIGVTMAVVGARLAVVVAALTFLAAFVPLVGAVAAGVVAVLVTLATTGPMQALVVGIVALVVQQLDNDVLAPVIYGKAVSLHPLTVLLGIAAGSALFGFVGTLLAVPVLAVAVNVWDEARRPADEAAVA